MYKLFMALRYLRAHKIIYFSIAGVAIGIMVLIIVTSVMGGFSRDIRARIRGMQSHIVVTVFSDTWMSNHDVLCAGIRKIPHVTGCAPRIEYIAWLTGAGRGMGRTSSPDVRVIGIDPAQEKGTGDLEKYFKRVGTPFEINDLEGELGSVVMGAARDHWPGMRIVLQTAVQAEYPEYRSAEFIVSGSFKTGMAEYDSQFVFTSLAGMQKFLRMMGKPYCNVLAIGVDDYAMHGLETRQAILEYLHSVKACNNPGNHDRAVCGKHIIQTWEEARSTLLQAVEIEKGIQSIILFFIVIVAGFNIIAIYTLMVRAKVRDVGILRALGATPGGVTLIFLLSGAFCGLVGTLLGILVGLLISRNLNELIDFVRISSRELHALSRPGGTTNSGTLLMPLVCFILGLVTLIVTWIRLYRPWKSAMWIPAALSGAFLAAGGYQFFAWTSSYAPRQDYDWAGVSGLRTGVMAACLAAPLAWCLVRWASGALYERFWGGIIRFVGTVLYSALIIFASLLSFVCLALLLAPPGPRFSGYDLFPRDIYYLDRIPVHIDQGTIVAIVIATLVVSLVFSIYPALKAARTDPIEAIRDE